MDFKKLGKSIAGIVIGGVIDGKKAGEIAEDSLGEVVGDMVTDQPELGGNTNENSDSSDELKRSALTAAIQAVFSFLLSLFKK